MVKGDRYQIEGMSLKIPSDSWEVLGLCAEGVKFAVTLNGKELFTATDSTFTGPGRVALWTKAERTRRVGLVPSSERPSARTDASRQCEQAVSSVRPWTSR